MKSLLWLLIFFGLLPAFSVISAENNSGTEVQVREKLNNYFWTAARDGDNERLKILIDARYNLNTADEKGYTAIILAAYRGHYDAVEMLIAAGADPCIRDKRGNTALMGAIFKGEVKVARLLIAAKCSPDIRNNSGQTAAMYASLFQRKALLEELEKNGADMRIKDINGNHVASLADGEINGIR